MARSTTSLLLFLCLATPAVAQDCFADYKAKKGRPLELHYGVVDLPARACNDPAVAARIIARRIARDGWELLTVQSVFGRDALAGKENDAGEYFLRY